MLGKPGILWEVVLVPLSSGVTSSFLFYCSFHCQTKISLASEVHDSEVSLVHELRTDIKESRVFYVKNVARDELRSGPTDDLTSEAEGKLHGVRRKRKAQN